MATLLGYLCFIRLKRGGAWLHLAGFAAAYAFSLRFVGLFFIAALALMAGIELLRSRNRAALLNAVRLLYLPILAVVWALQQLPRPGKTALRYLLVASAAACLLGQLHVAGRTLPFDPHVD